MIDEPLWSLKRLYFGCLAWLYCWCQGLPYMSLARSIRYRRRPYAELGAPMRRFYLMRERDVSGVSGTGAVAEGAVSRSGKVALFWLTQHGSVGLYESIEQVVAIHGHDGASHLLWVDERIV